MGHSQSTVLIGRKTELMLVRSVDYGGKLFGEALTADGALNAETARVLMPVRSALATHDGPRMAAPTTRMPILIPIAQAS